MLPDWSKGTSAQQRGASTRSYIKRTNSYYIQVILIGGSAFIFFDRVGGAGLRLLLLPHHRTCGFPHPAVERSDLRSWWPQGWMEQGTGERVSGRCSGRSAPLRCDSCSTLRDDLPSTRLRGHVPALASR